MLSLRRFYEVVFYHEGRKFSAEVEAYTENIALHTGAGVIGGRLSIDPQTLVTSPRRVIAHRGDYIMDELPTMTVGEAAEQHEKSVVDRLLEEVQNANARRLIGEAHHVIICKGTSITAIPISTVSSYLEAGFVLVGDDHLTPYQDKHPEEGVINAKPPITTQDGLIPVVDSPTTDGDSIPVNPAPSARTRRTTDRRPVPGASKNRS